MPDSFIPLVATPVSNGETAMPQLKLLPQGRTEPKAAFEPLPPGGRAEPADKVCGRPSVKLERQGDTVSAIRIECSCGQVIELACTY